MILNRQTIAKVDLAAAEALVGRLRNVLELAGQDFNICFVDDARIRALNAAFRGKPDPTDVLSFPWRSDEAPGPAAGGSQEPGARPREFEGFLGDVVISVETARRNAEAEGHAASTEISWLMLHGLLHLLGMDHETDRGEMVALELDLRTRLGVDGESGRPAVSKAKTGRPAGARGRKSPMSRKGPKRSKSSTRC